MIEKKNKENKKEERETKKEKKKLEEKIEDEERDNKEDKGDGKRKEESLKKNIRFNFKLILDSIPLILSNQRVIIGDDSSDGLDKRVIEQLRLIGRLASQSEDFSSITIEEMKAFNYADSIYSIFQLYNHNIVKYKTYSEILKEDNRQFQSIQFRSSVSNEVIDAITGMTVDSIDIIYKSIDTIVFDPTVIEKKEVKEDRFWLRYN